jgi:SAM-dependent methyltransferase
MSIKDYIFDIPWIFIKLRAILQSDFKIEKSIIQEHIPKNANVLDFGCGTGQYSELFEDNKYAGVDVPGPHISYAKRRFPKKTFVTFNEDFIVPWRSSFFDWIICFAVIHHVPPEGTKVFREEILRLLKPRGKILIVDPVPVESQKSAWSKSLLSLDRGRFPRLPGKVIEIFDKTVKVKEDRTIKIGSYSMYVLVLEKK